MSALTLPPYYDPMRRVHRWIRRRALAMAHLKKSASTGHLVKNTDGHLVNDCGFTPGVDCTNCDVGTAPAEMRITITSPISLCTCSSANCVMDSAPTGSSVGGQVGGSPCTWFNANAFTAPTWSPCPSGSPTSTVWVWSLEITAGSGTNNATYSFFLGAGACAQGFFSGLLHTDDEDEDCSLTRNMNNLVTSSSGCTLNFRGYGGSISVTPV